MLEDHSDLLADLAQLCFLQLGDIDTVDQHLAGGRPLQQVDAADQRRFPCAGKSDDADDIPVFDFQVNILARLNVQVRPVLSCSSSFLKIKTPVPNKDES